MNIDLMEILNLLDDTSSRHEGDDDNHVDELMDII